MTPAGPSEPTPELKERLVEAINQVFALFRLNYHNQFYAAYPDAGQLNQLKRLWLDALSDFPPEMILRGARHAIESSDYLPTLNRMLESCQQGLSDHGLPAPRDAYLEACQAPSPKVDVAWSHPAVYLAGRDSDWFFLANNAERLTWPIFRQHYSRYLLKVSHGEQLSIPERKTLPPSKGASMTAPERRAALAKLREELDL